MNSAVDVTSHANIILEDADGFLVSSRVQVLLQSSKRFVTGLNGRRAQVRLPDHHLQVMALSMGTALASCDVHSPQSSGAHFRVAQLSPPPLDDHIHSIQQSDTPNEPLQEDIEVVLQRIESPRRRRALL